MKCADCKNYKRSSITGKMEHLCLWHNAVLAEDVVESDQAEKDCVGFEKR